MGLQFLRFGKCEISTDQQFIHLLFSETITISTGARSAPEKIRYNFGRFIISTFLISAKCGNFNVVTISMFWEMIFYNNFNILTISMFDIFWMYDNFNVL